MGQNSSVDVGTRKGAPDASDSCVSGVKLRSTGIIPISELIKQEKCSKNIQKIEKNYYNKKKSLKKQPNEDLKFKKVKKPEFIDTSFEDVPARRQWVRINPEPTNAFECDAIKIGLEKPSKTILNAHQARSNERNQENNRHAKRENIRGNSQNANRESIRKNIGIGTQEFNNKNTLQKSPRKTEKRNIADQAKKSIVKNSIIEKKFKESSTQTITCDIAKTYENLKQIYKRNEIDEMKRIRHNYQYGKELRENTNKDSNKIKQQHHQLKQYKQQKKENALRDFEESTHQIQTHDIFHPKRKLRKYGKKFKIETNILCSIRPGKKLQLQTNSNKNKLERCPGRNYINRKLAGEYYKGDEKFTPCVNDVNSFNSSDMVQTSVSLLPSASTVEQAIKEHRKYVSAKEALESWKDLHTWKQHKKRYQRTRNNCHQGNFDAATQTKFTRPNSKTRNRSNHYIQTYPVIHEDIIVPSEKHLYKDFILKMEHCLQKHSRICELNTKRNGEAKYTWVQDKCRRWHKITFDDYKN